MKRKVTRFAREIADGTLPWPEVRVENGRGVLVMPDGGIVKDDGL